MKRSNYIEFYVRGLFDSVSPKYSQIKSGQFLKNRPGNSKRLFSALFISLMILQFTTASLYANATVNYSLKIQSPSGSGSTSPSTGTHYYTSGTKVRVTAYPSSGYHFDHWVKDGSNAGSSNPIYVYMGSSHTLKAVFTQTPISTMTSYSLTIQSSTDQALQTPFQVSTHINRVQTSKSQPHPHLAGSSAPGFSTVRPQGQLTR